MTTLTAGEQSSTKFITLLQALAATPAQVARISGSPTPPPQVSDVLGLMVRIEQATYRQLQRVIQEPAPALAVIQPDQLPLVVNCLSAPVDCFTRARMATLALLKELSPEEWQRPASHESLGQVSLWLLVQTLVDHDTLQVSQLTQPRPTEVE